jgi:phosphoglucosamine mutase
MQRANRPLSELAKVMDVFPQVLLNVAVGQKKPLEELPAVQQLVRDIEATLGNAGRVLVRYSGTQNLCRVMVEGPTTEQTQAYCQQIADALQKALA